LELKSDEDLRNYALTFKNTSQRDIVSKFVEECFDKTTSSQDGDKYQIEWKNIHFIWKQFLSNIGLPNIIYSTQLKMMLSELLSFNAESDSFIGITSKYLPYYKDFILFWETTIMYDNDDSSEFETEIEIDEINSLFKMWSKSKNSLSEENILKILKHFFPFIDIVEDKYILNVKSKLWDKVADIDKSIPFIKNAIQNGHNLSLISFDDIYGHYQNYCLSNSVKFIVSKRYFEKYLYHNYSNYIVYEKFIQIIWTNY
jgi:hypothetical protein